MKEKESAAAGQKRTREVVIGAVAAGAAVLLLLLPCILAAASGDKIYPRTAVAGIDVGGMTVSEAEELLSRDMKAAYENAVLPLTVDRGAAGGEKETFELALADIDVQADAGQAAQAAYEYGRSQNFFAAGVSYGRALLLGSSVAPKLSIDTERTSQLIGEIADQVDVPVTECSWRLDGETLKVTKPKSGYLLDRTALLEDVESAVGSFSMNGVHCALEESAPTEVTMEEIYTDAHREPSNAYYDKEEGVIKDGDVGIDFDPQSAEKLMDAAPAGAEFDVPVTLTMPKMTKEEMSKYLFRDVLGTCETGTTGSANRKHNVTRAAQSCNNLVLNPGEEFSYNQTLGQRTAANGYLPAGAYVNGKTVNEYGGGICQVSSTIYLATLRSNLEIVSRTNHMFYPGYIPYGMDATVSWGGPDFKFKNNTDYPIKLAVSYGNGKTTCTIYGTNMTGNSVKMEYSILSSTGYNTVEKPDSSLAPGTRRQEQNGYTGYKVATYRCVYDKDGNLLSRNLEANSNYQSRDRIILVGPSKDVPASAPAATPATPAAPTTPTAPETPAETPPPQETPSESGGGAEDLP